MEFWLRLLVIFVVLAITVVASMLKSRRTPEARAHAGTLREPREAREARRRQDS